MFFPLSSSNNVCSDGILPLTRMTNRFGEVAWCVRVNEDGEARFWEPKTAVCEELKLVEKAIPSSTKYKKKWTVKNFVDW